VIVTLCKILMASLDPVTAEATIALHTVEFCRDVGCQDVILEGDSLSVVKAIFSREPTRHSYGQVIEDIKVVLRSRRTWRACHTKRGVNGAAHKLAKEATWCFSDKIWLEETPSCIFHIVSLELSALSL
jgi:hypothetical protein